MKNRHTSPGTQVRVPLSPGAPSCGAAMWLLTQRLLGVVCLGAVKLYLPEPTVTTVAFLAGS
ncbi:hypothetical protein LX90_004327 [Lentzea flava]|nr:hypothetical protein [Lentzea flava]